MLGAPQEQGKQVCGEELRPTLAARSRARQGRLWITCNPDNIASMRTCEILGAELVETVDVPEGITAYRKGERQKLRYKLEL